MEDFIAPHVRNELQGRRRRGGRCPLPLISVSGSGRRAPPGGGDVTHDRSSAWIQLPVSERNVTPDGSKNVKGGWILLSTGCSVICNRDPPQTVWLFLFKSAHLSALMAAKTLCPLETFCTWNERTVIDSLRTLKQKHANQNDELQGGGRVLEEIKKKHSKSSYWSSV